MRDVRKYWQDVQAMARLLPEFLWVASEEGCLVEVSAELGAKLLIGKSHRVATEDEIRARREADAARNREMARRGRRKRGIEVVAVEQELDRS
jgi:hypothetical protein